MGTTDTDILRARSRLYGLLGSLLLDGFTAEALETARLLPALATALPDGIDADHLAARHHQAFGMGVPPYEGVLVGAEGHMGGDRAAAARETLAATGLSEPRTDVEGDHLGLLLRAAGFLCAAEADAIRDGEVAAATELRALQARVLDGHLLPAWPMLAVAIDGLDLSEWSAVVGLTAALLASHRTDLAGAPQVVLPEVPTGLLDDPKTGLKRIVAWLIVPGQAGFWLSRRDVDALAAAVDLPHGFGDRFKMLESLVFAAVDNQRVEGLMDGLLDVVERWQRGFDALADEGLPVQAWVERLAGTRDIVRTVRAAVATA
jgi:TorA maturation chaperone TorD